MTPKPSFMTFLQQLRYLPQQVQDRLEEWFLLVHLHFPGVLVESEMVDRLPHQVVATDLLRHLELPQMN